MVVPSAANLGEGMSSVRGPNRIGALVVVVVAAGAMMSGGCAFGLDAVVQRASNEFACPREQVEVIERNDIGQGTYDLDACGSRARYTCFAIDDNVPNVRCVREPDPPRWDPDPALLASLPRPPGMSGHGRVVRICYRGEQADDCLVREGGAWRWNHHEAPKIQGGLGVRGE